MASEFALMLCMMAEMASELVPMLFISVKASEFEVMLLMFFEIPF